MSDSDKAQVDSFKQFGIATLKIMAYMAGQSGRYGMLRFTKRDLYNYVHGQRVAQICDGDVGVHMGRQQVQEAARGFFGSNHHKQTSIFGFALLEDEEVRTYRWVMLNLLDVMGQKKPCVVVTDGDKAMRAAIAEVMPTARHRLCGWHLEKNCIQRVKNTEFCKVFKKALYANFEINDFEEFWKLSVESLGLRDNNWV
ncbi:protein FAR1-RELATED SEQUENCE 5-like [Arachis ipaensis]|uniref:protein FAR1-RELATED SEQUENCE 5-like n=1 Tax=Arachis ipaensis TaxID=130454 RepID=UPI0007AFB595|nr:protein FAR1-RELATED SEQUENCE 5-like [Arachis ipaensis]